MDDNSGTPSEKSSRDGMFLRRYIQDESLLAVWRASVMTGAYSLVEVAIKKDGLDGNIPVEGDLPPLVSLSRMVPKDAEEAKKLARVAYLLIQHKAVLNLPDRCGLFPADYALFSPSSMMARVVTLATLRHNINRQSQRFFRPNYRAVFARIVSEKEATAQREALITNIGAVRNAIQSLTLHGDAEMRELPIAERAYWDRIEIPELAKLPTPTPDMAFYYDLVSEIRRHQAEGMPVDRATAEDAEDTMRMREIEHCSTFKPDYT